MLAHLKMRSGGAPMKKENCTMITDIVHNVPGKYCSSQRMKHFCLRRLPVHMHDKANVYCGGDLLWPCSKLEDTTFDLGPSCSKLEDAVRHQVRRALNIPGRLKTIYGLTEIRNPLFTCHILSRNEIGSSDFWHKQP